MNSPPMTPPELALEKPSLDSAQLTDMRRVLDRSESLLKLSASSLETQLANISKLARTIPRTIDMSVSGAAQEDLHEVLTHSLRFVRCAIIILEEIDAEDDIRYAQQNCPALATVEESVQAFDHVIRVQLDLPYGNSVLVENFSITSDVTGLQEIKQSWQQIRVLISKIRTQNLAVNDWTDCQESLDAIQIELKDLATLMYTLQEQRHLSLNPAVSVELDVLATILEDPPEGENTGTPNKKLNDDGLSRWDRSLSEAVTKLTGKLSPLKASISMFQPRLEAFRTRAQIQFPTAVQKLQCRCDQLEEAYNQLIKDFKQLKQELGDDKWMAVFRQVNKQASEMMGSLSRTLKRLDSVPFTNTEASRLAESFEIKAEHYGASVPSVLSIMHRGVKDRSTLNGEIIRGYDLLTQQWAQLSIDLADMARRIRGARAMGLLQKEDYSRSTSTYLGTGFATPQQLNKRRPVLMTEGRRRTANRLASRQSDLAEHSTPQRLAKSTRESPLPRCYSPSPAIPAFRKDTSLDPPRSRSRLSSARDTGITGAAKPPWNAGTVARVLDQHISSVQSSPIHTPARSLSHLGLIDGELKKASNASGIPMMLGRNNASTLSGNKDVSKDVVERLAIPELHRTLNKASAVMSSPGKSRLTSTRPQTPTSIPVPKRLISFPDTNLSTPSRPRTASSLRTSINASSALLSRSTSSLAHRRQSGIPVATPHK